MFNRRQLIVARALTGYGLVLAGGAFVRGRVAVSND
jgi:hypothetical protein